MQIDLIISSLREISTAVEKIVGVLSETPEKPEKQAENTSTEHSFEEVRGVLAGLSADGHTKEVKAILTKFGYKKLSDVRKEDYGEILREVEKIGS